MNGEMTKQFTVCFQQATGHEPYPFQVRFACEPELPELVEVPTGLGKTAMAVLGWVWRRRFHPDERVRKSTPRRLVYCLPMRVLVEQTAECARQWTANLKTAGHLADDIAVHVLMGGEEEEDWDMYPELEQILIGTQDMLLSRALNRGYAATRSRWPIKFGLLNTECLWVFDEIQLMGAGLATTAQLEAFRRLLPDKQSDHAKNRHGCRSVWMSATLQRDWLGTVDFAPFLTNMRELRFSFQQEIVASGLGIQARKALEDRWTARKPLAKAEAMMGDIKALAKEVLEAHQPGTRTIVIVNTVKRAREVFDALRKAAGKASLKPELVLLHSRFRPEDRKRQVERALAQPEEPGTIVVSTQVIEAGVDVSATTLFTDVAPWASLVQRFGRCNRYGRANDQAKVYWLAMPTKDSDAEKLAAPYKLRDLKDADEQLGRLPDVGLKALRDISLPVPFEHAHVIRRKDLLDLFDTTPDLAGNDIDVDRFIRDVDDSDVQVFWRDYGETPNETDEQEAQPAARREELCPAPIGEFREFVKQHKRQVWRWNFLDERWDRASTIIPGQVYLVHANAGGYSVERGWDPRSEEAVQPIGPSPGTRVKTPDATDADPLSQIGTWQTIAEHTDDLRREVDQLLRALVMDGDDAEAVRQAARWHDRGKAHDVFQAAVPVGAPVAAQLWAKAPKRGWKRYTRRHFRHELASAMAVLDPRNTLVSEEIRNLVAYLVAAHHGKVRLSVRSLPNESRPDAGRRFARGVWDGDELPETDLGDGTVAPRVTLSLEPMELGLCEQPPFTGRPSWVERMIGLRDTLGPFRLAYLEAILRAADMRASRDAAQKAVAKQQDHVSPQAKDAAS
jgi:CRISPR-associated endonuclease/helicase Cas3